MGIQANKAKGSSYETFEFFLQVAPMLHSLLQELKF